MSTLMLISETTHQVVPQLLPLAAGDGILDWGNGKIAETETLLKGLAIVIGIVFVIVQAVMSRGAMARIVISGLAAAIFVWVVFNVTDLRDRVDNEVNSAPAPAGLVEPPQAG